MNFMAVVTGSSTVVPFRSCDSTERQLGPPDNRGEPRSGPIFFYFNHDLFGMLLCVLLRISDMRDLGDR